MLFRSLATGETAYIIGFNCGWYKVQYEGQTGYIRSDLLALTEAPKYNSQLTVGSAPVVTTVGQKIASYAQDFIGVPYVWGGSSPSGFDCSGFVQYVMRSCGYTVGRGTDAQYFNGDGTYVSKDALVPGDMIFFFGTYDTTGTSHVGIYIGDGQYIHASSAGGCVKISDLYTNYTIEHYYGAKRVF